MKKSKDASPSSTHASAHLRQLSDADAVFLSVERPEAPSHIAGLTILDAPSCPEFGFDRFLEILAERIEQVGRFKWKLFEPLLGLDRAYWVEDDDFDVADHVHRVAVARPGDRAALAELAGLLHARPLDRSRPLWETWWIEGLEGQRVAMLMKVHHCLMDGQSGMGLSEILMDLTPVPVRTPPVSTDDREPQPRRPAIWEMGRAAMTNGLRLPGAVVSHAGRALAAGLGRGGDATGADTAPRVHRTSFNGRLTGNSSFTYATVPLGPLRDAKKHFNVTMNDVLLEIVASSLRRGLIARGELPSAPVVGLCPVSLRRNGDQTLGNQISSMPVSLATHIDNAPGRLAAIHASAESAKRRLEAGAFETLSALGECLLPGALKLFARVAHGFPSLVPLPANLVISNVRGLPVPMYMAGARVEEFYPISMLQVANGMNVTAVTHDDQVDFGFLTDSKLVRDPWIYADGVALAVRELEAAVESLSETRPPEDIVPREEATGAGPVVGEGPDAASSEAPAPLGDDGLAPEERLLDLQMMMSGFGHLRAPSRQGDPLGETSDENERE